MKNNDNVSDVGMGVGMILLAPILEKANFTIVSTRDEDIFTSKLLIKPPK